jgi:hypothetical protein
MSDKSGPQFVGDGHYIADPGIVNSQAEYIRDAVMINHVYHICKREMIEGKDNFWVGRLNYSPTIRKYYCEKCHEWKPLKDFWKEKEGTGTEGHA